MKNAIFRTTTKCWGSQIWLMLFSFLLPGYFCAQVVSIPTNVWIQKQPTYVGAPDGGQIFPAKWNNKGVYDPISQKTIVYDRWYDAVRGGSIYANALLAYDPYNNVVTVLKLSNWKYYNYQTVAMTENTTDPTPIDRHPLGLLALATDNNTIYISNGPNQTAPNNSPNDTWGFDLATNSWSMVSNDNTLAPNPPFGTCVMTYDSVNKVVAYFVQKNGMYQGTETWLLNTSTEKWSVVAQDPTALTVNTSASGIAYDSKRGRILTFGGGYDFNGTTPNLWAYSVAQNKWTALANCPKSANAPGFDYDSKNDIFLALIDTTTWVYDPKVDTWSEIQTPMDRAYYYEFQNITYNVAQDVFVFQGGTWDQPRWELFRYNKSTVGMNDPVSTVNMDVYPNPNNGMFSIQLKNNADEKVNLSVFDMAGNTVYLETVGLAASKNSHEINMSKYAKGVYTLKAISSTGVVNKKIIVQ